MSREDDFDDIMDSPNDAGDGADDNSEPLLEDESVYESSTAEVVVVALPEPEPVIAPPAPVRKPTAKKKKKVAAKPKPKAKKKKAAEELTHETNARTCH